MNRVYRGVVEGNTIKLTEPARLADGRELCFILVEGGSNGLGSANEPRFSTPSGMQIARAAFLRDLPTLLINKNCAGKWVLYHGEKRIKTARTQEQLVRYCWAQGWDAGD